MASTTLYFTYFVLVYIALLSFWSLIIGFSTTSPSSFKDKGAYMCEGSHSQNIDQIRGGIYDTAPFNRSNLIPALFTYRAEYQVAPMFHLSFCRIEKVMTTIFDAIFCYINNKTEFEANNRRISTELYQTRKATSSFVVIIVYYAVDEVVNDVNKTFYGHRNALILQEAGETFIISLAPHAAFHIVRSD